MATLYFKNSATPNFYAAWNFIGNWWNDAGLTIPAGRIPLATDSVVITTGSYLTGIASNDSLAGSPVSVVNVTFNNSDWDFDLNGIGINCETAVFNSSNCFGISNLANISINASSSITFNGTSHIDAGVFYSPTITLNGSTSNSGGDGPSIYSGPTGYTINVNGTSYLSSSYANTQFYNDPNIVIANSAVLTNLQNCLGVASVTITGGGGGGISQANVLLTELLKLPFPIVL